MSTVILCVWNVRSGLRMMPPMPIGKTGAYDSFFGVAFTLPGSSVHLARGISVNLANTKSEFSNGEFSALSTPILVMTCSLES